MDDLALHTMLMRLMALQRGLAELDAISTVLSDTKVGGTELSLTDKQHDGLLAAFDNKVALVQELADSLAPLTGQVGTIRVAAVAECEANPGSLGAAVGNFILQTQNHMITRITPEKQPSGEYGGAFDDETDLKHMADAMVSIARCVPILVAALRGA